MTENISTTLVKDFKLKKHEFIITITFLSESSGDVKEDQEDRGPSVILRSHHNKGISFAIVPFWSSFTRDARIPRMV